MTTALISIFLIPATANAQFTGTFKDWYGHIAAGYSTAQGDMADIADDGWNFSGGATYYPQEWLVGISMGLDFEQFDLSREVLDAFDATDGDLDIRAFTTGLTWSPRLKGPVGFYINGGIGAYYLKGRLKEPAVLCGPVCPPYSWWCYPGCYPGDVTTDSISETKFGYNIGVGITLRTGQTSTVYLEVKYNRIETEVVTEYMPVLLGFRW